MIALKTLKLVALVAVEAGLVFALWRSLEARAPRCVREPDVRLTAERIGRQCELFRLDNGRYPETLMDLVRRPQSAPRWRGPYVAEEPRDAWNRPFAFSEQGFGYAVRSLGPDGREGTEDDIVHRTALCCDGRAGNAHAPSP